jgi:hypothetical protein
LAFDICGFDYTASVISHRFEPFVVSTEKFSLEVRNAIKGLEKRSLPDDVGSSHALMHENDVSGTTLVNENLSRERPAKRPANHVPTEVDPLPAELKKQKKEEYIEYDEDKGFLDMVKKNYLIREGMRKYFPET